MKKCFHKSKKHIRKIRGYIRKPESLKELGIVFEEYGDIKDLNEQINKRIKSRVI